MHETLLHRMIAYNAGMPELTQHLIKVYQFAHLIAEGERLDPHTQFILETAAIVHDIGIRNSLRIYGDDAGPHQEALGPGEAEAMLTSLHYDSDVIARVCYLVGHHHTYTGIDGMDYRILVEADFLVNLFENHAPPQRICKAQETMFETQTGKMLLKTMFAL